MRIQRSVRFLLAAVAFLAAASVAEAQTVAYADPGTTNLRAGPGTNYAKIGRVYGGTQVYVQFCEYGWCYITVHGREGWMIQSRLRFGRGPVIVPAPAPSYQPYFNFGWRFDDHDRRHYDRRRRDDRREEGWSSEDPGGGSRSDQYWRRKQWLDRQLER